MTYSNNDIYNSLIEVGLKNSDDVFIHSNLGFFGVCEGVKSADGLSKLFYEAIVKIIGASGTIIVPTFTYSGCKGEDFDPAATQHKMGMFSNYIMNLPSSIRSLDCNFSIAAVGGRSEYYTSNVTENSFDENSFFGRMYLKNCKILNFNFDAGTTYVHFVEKKLNVPYRYDKKFSSRIKLDGDWLEVTSYHYVCDLNKPGDTADFIKLHEICVKNNVAKIVKLGKGTVLLVSSHDLYDVIEKTLIDRPRFLLKVE